MLLLCGSPSKTISNFLELKGYGVDDLGEVIVTKIEIKI